MSAKYKSPSFLLPNEINTNTNPLNTDGNPATGTGVNSLYSMNFPGNSGTATLGGLTSTIIQGDLLTISFWYYPTSIGSSDYIIGSGSNSFGPFGVSRNGANIRIRWRNSAGTLVALTTTDAPVQINTWYHLCAIFDTTSSTATDKIQIWINGVRNTTGDTSLTGSGFSSVSASTDTLINKFRASPVNRSITTNKVDELAFFNKVLTSTEIAALYDGTGSNKRPSNLMATNLNPIAYYPLGEEAQNSGYLSASGNEWQFPNGVLQDYVMDFNGGDYIDLNGSQKTMIGENANFTISVWFNTSTNSFQGVFGSFNTQRFYLGINRGTGRFYMALGGGTNESGVMNFSLNTWHNITVVKDGTSIKYYLNGSLGSTVTHNGGNYGTHTQNLFLGAYNQTGNINHFTGKLSNMAIWKTAITDANEIANIYNNSSPQTSYTVAPQNWWKLNADSVYTPSAPSYTNCIDPVQDNYREQIIVNTNGTNLTTWTVSMWAFGRSFTPSHLWSASNNGYNLYWQSYQLKLWGTMVADYTVIPSSQDYKWGHYVVTREAGVSKVYFNGKEIYSGTAGGTLFVNDLFIGGWNRYNYPTGNVGEIYNWGEPISNFGAWDSALTPSQVSTLFNFGTPETTPSFSPLHYFKLDNITTGLNNIGSSSANAVITPNSGNSGNGVISNDTNAVAVVPSWKIPSALTIPTVNYTSSLFIDESAQDRIDLNCTISGSTITGDGINLATTNTIAFWLYNSPTEPSAGPILGGPHSTTSGNNFGTLIRASGGASMASEKYGSIGYWLTGQQAFGSSALNATRNRQWQHFAFVRNGSTVTLYIDGQTGSASDYQITLSIPANETIVYNIGEGINHSSGSFHADAYISNLQLFSTNLPATGSESIESLYNNGQPKDITGFSNIAAWYTLTDTTTTSEGGLHDNGSSNFPANNSGASKIDGNVLVPSFNIPTNGVSTTLPSTALQQSDLQFDSPYSNYSLYFDGASSRVQALYNLPSGVTKFSVSIWGNVEGAGSSVNKCLISNEDGNAADGYALFTEGTYPNTKVWFKIENNTSTQTTSNIVFGEWFHVLGTYDNGTAKIYFNGVLEDTTTGVPAINTSSLVSTMIGSYRESNPIIPMLGHLDEAAIWETVALTDAQVLQIYNNGKPNDISSLSPTNWWRLGENAYFNNGNKIVTPNSIIGGVNGIGSGTVNDSLSANAPGTYANGIGTDLDIIDRVGDAPLSVSNSQSYNMIPDDKIPYVPGYVGDQISNTYSMTFDPASNTRFEVAYNTSFGFGTSGFTISLWINFDSLNSNGYNILDFRSSSGPSNVGSLWINSSNGLRWYVSGGYLSASIPAASFSNNTWYNVIILNNGSTTSFYLNGSLVDSASDTTNYAAAPLVIGDYFGGSYVVNGKIDEIAIFNKELTADQIKFDLYKPTSEGTNQTADIANNPNLPTPVAWYRMGD